MKESKPKTAHATPAKSPKQVNDVQVIATKKTRQQSVEVVTEPDTKPAWMQRLFRLSMPLVTLSTGTAIVALWTVIRCISNGVNFDVVGQVGVTEQWMHGLHGGAQLGATNYLLKMPLYLLINHCTFLTPQLRLIILALAFNILTFVLLFVIYNRTMKLFDVRSRGFYRLAVIWLATIAGNVFWLDYANSRNLETAGGLYLFYISLKLMRRWQWRTVCLLAVIAIIVFFADPLQAYIFVPTIVLFTLGRLAYYRTRADARYASGAIVATALGVILARLLQVPVRHYLHITFLTAPNNHPALTLANGLATLHGLWLRTLAVFDANFLKGSLGPNTLRQAINACLLTGLVLLLIRFMYLKRKDIWNGYGLLLLAIVMNYVVYVASGQVLAGETSRYLIMVPLLLLMLAALAGDVLESLRFKRQLMWACGVVLALIVILLSGALAVNWHSRFSKDGHIDALISFMNQQGFTYALGSREAGITTTYFSQGRVTILPSACDGNHVLGVTNLFYDSAAFSAINTYKGEVPILLQNNEIKFGAYTCSREEIILQLGAPKREIIVPGYGSALVYSSIQYKAGSYWATAVGLPTATSLKTNSDVPPFTNLAKLNNCSTGTLDTVIAHPDDDILFMNPVLAAQVASKCIRTVYITAGDDGRPMSYWLERQQGIETAYAHMVGSENKWSDTYAAIDGHKILTRNLEGHPNINLVFLRLPDGNVHGEGFEKTGFNSLEKIFLTKASLKTVDNADSYSYADITKVVSDILIVDKPHVIFTHLFKAQLSVGDHSDHRAVGALTAKARTLAKSNAQVSLFVGYPLNFMAKNLNDEEIASKRATFEAYALDDQLICRNASNCSIETTYGKYLERCYEITQLQDLVRAQAAQMYSSPSSSPKPSGPTNELSHSTQPVIDILNW